MPARTRRAYHIGDRVRVPHTTKVEEGEEGMILDVARSFYPFPEGIQYYVVCEGEEVGEWFEEEKLKKYTHNDGE